MVTLPLFAMTTGHFSSTLTDQDVMFMVNSGSQLNLISKDLHSQTGVVIDLDGTRWSLKGINGGVVPLVGCCREVPMTIGGHHFDHHFFCGFRDRQTRCDPWLTMATVVHHGSSLFKVRHCRNEGMEGR